MGRVRFCEKCGSALSVQLCFGVYTNYICSQCNVLYPIESAAPKAVYCGGRKDDAGKPQLRLVPPNALLATAKVLTHGAEKYGADNWKQIEDIPGRYMDAALRHLNAHQRGEELDPESSLPHLAHAIASLMFILEAGHTTSTPPSNEFQNAELS